MGQCRWGGGGQILNFWYGKNHASALYLAQLDDPYVAWPILDRIDLLGLPISITYMFTQSVVYLPFYLQNQWKTEVFWYKMDFRGSDESIRRDPYQLIIIKEISELDLFFKFFCLQNLCESIVDFVDHVAFLG